jgi:hypothetical protein
MPILAAQMLTFDYSALTYCPAYESVLLNEALMHQPASTISEIDARLRVLAIRLQQQERIIESVQPGPGRLEALSTYAELLRRQHDLQMQRQWLSLSDSDGWNLSGTIATAKA